MCAGGGGGLHVWGERGEGGIETMSCLDQQNLLLTSPLVKMSAGLTRLLLKVHCIWGALPWAYTPYIECYSFQG